MVSAIESLLFCSYLPLQALLSHPLRTSDNKKVSAAHLLCLEFWLRKGYGDYTNVRRCAVLPFLRMISFGYPGSSSLRGCIHDLLIGFEGHLRSQYPRYAFYFLSYAHR